jgi:NADPH-dependent ferric siderophore reductase
MANDTITTTDATDGSTPAPLPADVLAELDETIEHLNANHADTMLLVARLAGGWTAAVDAEATAVDTRGIDFELVVDHGRERGRVEFGRAVTTVDDVRAEFFAALSRAREQAGSSVPLTSLEREFVEQVELRTFVTEVRATRELTPNLREVVVGGAGLADFVPRGGDEFLFVMVPRSGGAPIPDDFSMSTWIEEDAGARPRGAYYTVRRWDPEPHELTLWAVRHGHADSVGGFFARCQPGDRLALWGPREGFWSQGAYAPAADPRHHLFVTDESGFCAVVALLERLPTHDTATVIAETVDADHRIAFPGERTNVRWRDHADEPTLLDLVRETVTHAEAPLSTAFGAGESREITRIRKFLRHEVGLPASVVSMTGYWRRPAAH